VIVLLVYTVSQFKADSSEIKVYACYLTWRFYVFTRC